MGIVNLKAKNPKLIIEALQKLGKATSNALTKVTGKPKGTVVSALTALHVAGMIHIGAWELNSTGHMTRVYYWGDGKDVDAPIAKPRDQVSFTPQADIAAAWLRNPL